MGSGGSEYERGALILSEPRGRFAETPVSPGEAQRSGFARKRRSKGAGAVFAARRKRSLADFATTSRHGQSRSPPAGGEIFLGRRRKRAAQVCRPYGEREGFRAVRTPPLHRKTGLEKNTGSPPLATKRGNLPLPASNFAPLAHKISKTGHRAPAGVLAAAGCSNSANFFRKFTAIFQGIPPL